MAKGGLVKHLGIPGYLRVPVPACGVWSRSTTSVPGAVTCPDCKSTLDFAIAAKESDSG